VEADAALSGAGKSVVSFDERLARVGPAFQSLQSVGAFGFVLLVLLLIALPGMKGLTGHKFFLWVGGCTAFAVSGTVLGILGKRACAARTPVWLWVLRPVAWLALLHFPFGTWAGARALLAMKE
jgi:hypothetical protein